MKPKNPLNLEGARPLSEKATDALQHLGASRRDFLKTAGVLMIGFASGATTGKAQNPSGNVDNSEVDSWVAIGADNSITVLAGKCDFGQGLRTIQLQLAAEELSVSMDRITLVLCKTGITPNQGYTAGSFSTFTQFGGGGLRIALDTARDALFQLASQYLHVAVSQLTVNDGVFSVIGDPSRTVSYGQLVQGQGFHLKVNSKAVPNDPSTWKILGKPVPRVDIPAKVKGTFQYVQKVRIPGMLHGKVVRPAFLGARVQSIDKSVVSGLAGNPQVVQVNDFVGVVADTEWHALKAAEALAKGITWSAGDTLPGQADLYTYMTQQPSRDTYAVHTEGALDVDQVMPTAAKTLSAQYLYPFQIHGSLASSCAVVDVQGGTGENATVKAWSATQSVYNVRTYLSGLLGIPTANIEVMQVEGSGCYGGNGNDPVTFDAALLSQAIGKPVRLQYTRKDEMTAGEHYGHPMVSNQKVGLDSSGTIIAWENETVLMVRGEGPLAAFTFGGADGPGNFIPGALAGLPESKVVPTPPNSPLGPFGGPFWDFGNSVPPYWTGNVGGVNLGTGTVASQRALTRLVESPLWTSYLRSPDHIQNTWSNESFMDEIAASLKQDPVLYRLRYLTDPRLIAVINAVTQKAGWETRPSPRPGNPHSSVVRGRGMSCVLYSGFDGYVAVVAEVRVNQDTGVITVTKVTAGIDTGPVINPDGLRNQMEGQVLQAMSRALFEEVKFTNQGAGGVGGGTITTDDWDSYTVLEFGDNIPEIETVLINNLKVAPTGAGETIITLMPAAIGNAVFDATGVRLRQIPMTPANFLAAKAAQKV